ncbi:type III polyketide synthase [Streptomyces sp. CC224B]|uniref:type III polyketide synthase n=1 Tax=Streptomyces sp. CC224B TaxID=3044571 RepID=UPI0024A94E60|nr:type III polyketide synthase [Streptomyces sp. CC224B]
MRRKSPHRPPHTEIPAPRVVAIGKALPPYRYAQEDITSALARATRMDSPTSLQVLRQVRENSGVATRHLSAPLPELARLTDFTEANRAWRRTALELAERALTEALEAAEVLPREVDAVISTTVTGLAVPSLEGLLAHRAGLRPDVQRVPLFGHGCAGGAAGLARLNDYLRAHPGRTAVLLAVELCSLTFRPQDGSMTNLIAGSLFGDGAAAVVAVGGHRATADGPALLDSHSRLVPGTEAALGWEIGSFGFRILLSPDIPALVAEHLPPAARALLGAHGLEPRHVGSWICHGGGPKVLTAVEEALGLPPAALDLTRRSLAEHGNLSSVAVLDVLRTRMSAPPPQGTVGLVAAMGPGFAIELVLLRW